MPDPQISSLASNQDLTCFDPGGAAPPPAPAAPDAASCYACADALVPRTGGAVDFLVETHDGHGRALVHGEQGPFSFELGDVYAQSDAQGAAIGVTTIAVRADVGPVQVEVAGPSAGAEAGFSNVSGAKGYHAGAHAALAHGEATAQLAPDTSLTFGGGVGAEIEFSGDVRDADADGRSEICFRAELDLLVGACFEPADVADAAVAAGRAVEHAAKALVDAFDAPPQSR